MSTKVKLILMCGLGILILLGVIGFGVDAVRNGFGIYNVLIFVGALVTMGWWIRDFRRILDESKASKEDEEK